MAKTEGHSSLSAVSNHISRHHAKSESTALPLEIIHNLEHQHSWQDLRLHAILNDTGTPELLDLNSTHLPVQSPRSHSPEQIFLISGLPPRHSYLHPDLQNHLIRRKISEKSVLVQREWVLPMSLGEKWTLKKFCQVFDVLPQRDTLQAEDGADLVEWRDAKRVLMGMLSTNGMGGDGTVVYYIMQEGEVKPRQNG